MPTGTLLEAQTAFTSDSLGSAFVERGPCRQVHFWRHKLPSLSTLWGQRLWKGDLEDRYTFGGTNCLHYRLFGVSVCGKGTLPTGTLLEAHTALGLSSFRDDFFESPKPKRNCIKMCRTLNMREQIKKKKKKSARTHEGTHAHTHARRRAQARTRTQARTHTHPPTRTRVFLCVFFSSSFFSFFAANTHTRVRVFVLFVCLFLFACLFLFFFSFFHDH